MSRALLRTVESIEYVGRVFDLKLLINVLSMAYYTENLH